MRATPMDGLRTSENTCPANPATRDPARRRPASPTPPEAWAPVARVPSRGLGGVDLRRALRRDLAERLVLRAEHLPPDERALVEAVFRDGRSVSEIARLAGVADEHATVRSLRRRLHRAVERALSDRFIYVASHLKGWPATRRRVAQACFLNGRSMREAARELGLTLHVVRSQSARINAMYDAVAGS